MLLYKVYHVVDLFLIASLTYIPPAEPKPKPIHTNLITSNIIWRQQYLQSMTNRGFFWSAVHDETPRNMEWVPKRVRTIQHNTKYNCKLRINIHCMRNNRQSSRRNKIPWSSQFAKRLPYSKSQAKHERWMMCSRYILPSHFKNSVL